MPLETGRYTIVHPSFGKVIGAPPTKPTIRPVRAIAQIGSIQEPIFLIERLAQLGAFNVPLYRIRLEDQLVTAEDGVVVVDASIPTPQATVWIMESRGDDIYGLIQGQIGQPIEPLAWTLRSNVVDEQISISLVPQTKSIPPQSSFKEGQLFRILRAD